MSFGESSRRSPGPSSISSSSHSSTHMEGRNQLHCHSKGTSHPLPAQSSAADFLAVLACVRTASTENSIIKSIRYSIRIHRSLASYDALSCSPVVPCEETAACTLLLSLCIVCLQFRAQPKAEYTICINCFSALEGGFLCHCFILE